MVTHDWLLIMVYLVGAQDKNKAERYLDLAKEAKTLMIVS